MRVVLVVLENFPGSENRVQRQANALSAAGHDVRILCARGADTVAVFNGMPVERTWTRRVKEGRTARRFLEYVAFPLECGLRLVSRYGAWRPDVIQVANMPDWLVLVALPMRWFFGSALLLDLHDLMPELMDAKGGSRIARSALGWLERVSCRAARRVITANDIFASLLTERTGLDVVAVPNGPDEAVFPVTPPRRRAAGVPVTLGFHGTVAPRFGLDVVVRALALLVADGRDVRCVVWGSGDGVEAVRSVASELGLADRVDLRGQVPSASLADELKVVDIAVVPYRRDPYMTIAYSTKAFEDAALGIPMVVADLPSLRQQFSDCAVCFFEPDDPEALAAAVLVLADDPDAACAMAQRAQQEVRPFLWSSVSAAYVRELEAAGETRRRA
jgi:glycosyltransferase involved in cell wall biosynthesis